MRFVARLDTPQDGHSTGADVKPLSGQIVILLTFGAPLVMRHRAARVPAMQPPPLSQRYQRGDHDLRGAIEAEKRVYETPSNWTPWEHEPPQESRGHVHRAAGPHTGTGIGLRAATTSACVQYVMGRGRPTRSLRCGPIPRGKRCTFFGWMYQVCNIPSAEACLTLG